MLRLRYFSFAITGLRARTTVATPVTAFMIRPFAASVTIAAVIGLAAPARAGITVGVVAPSGKDGFAVLGDQLRQGIVTYQKTGGQPFAGIVDAPETCDDSSGVRAAHAMISAKVGVVIGFLCPESLNAALPLLSKAHIATVTTTVRADIIMEDALRKNWPFYRLAPHESQEVQKIVEVIAHRWSGEPFALVEDGTIYGRQLTENVRVALEGMGVTPAFIDTYRPAEDKQFGLAHRLARSGVTHVFIGGERPDVAIIARDCGKIGLRLTFMGGDALKAPPGDVQLADGVLGVMTPLPDTLPSAGGAVAALRSQGIEPYGERVPGYAAAELVAAASKAGKPLPEALASGTFDTALGTIRFNGKHERADNPFELMIWRDDHFFPVEQSGKGLGE